MTSHGCGCGNHNEMQGTACSVIREMRQTPAQRMEEYYEIIRGRQGQREREGAVDVPYRLQRMGVPVDCVVALRAPVETQALAFARKALLAERELVRTLVLAGPRGVGKSVAAAYVLADVVRRWDWNNSPSGGKQHKPFAWCHAAEVTSQTDFGRVDPDWIEGLREARVLVVDDLGKDGTTPGLGALRDLLTVRHERRRLTVLTSNLGPKELLERYGPSWLERLKVAASFPDLSAEKSLRKKP